MIAETLINELSIIVETIAPSKLVQCKKNYAPWLEENFFEQSRLRDELHHKATLSNSPDDWRVYRMQRNKVNKINTNNKKITIVID